MRCPTCDSPKGYLHPGRVPGEKKLALFVSVGHAHSYKEKPVTIVICNDTFHAGSLSVMVLDAELVLSTSFVKPAEAQEELFTYLKDLTGQMRKLGYDKDLRLKVLANPLVREKIDLLTQKAFP